jgi:hypothetical protein
MSHANIGTLDHSGRGRFCTHEVEQLVLAFGFRVSCNWGTGFDRSGWFEEYSLAKTDGASEVTKVWVAPRGLSLSACANQRVRIARSVNHDKDRRLIRCLKQPRKQACKVETVGSAVRFDLRGRSNDLYTTFRAVRLKFKSKPVPTDAFVGQPADLHRALAAASLS